MLCEPKTEALGLAFSLDCLDDLHLHSDQGEAVPWSELPANAWAAILSYVSLSERLCVCAIVSKQLREAALATTEVILNASISKCAAMKQWLTTYAGRHNVKRLELIQPEGEEDRIGIRSIPFPGLQQLRICGLKVQLGSCDNHPGMLAAATRLEHLFWRTASLLAPPTTYQSWQSCPPFSTYTCSTTAVSALKHMQQQHPYQSLLVGHSTSHTFQSVAVLQWCPSF